jgi:hypothetical protein
MNPPAGSPSSAIARWITFLRDRPRLLRAIFFAALGFFVLYDVYAPRHGAHFVGDRIRGFWAAFGLVGCVLMARFMKGIGHLWLMKPVDFYRHEEGKEE